jgi:hypothetical protein
MLFCSIWGGGDVFSRDVLPLNRPITSLLMLADKGLAPNLGLDIFELLVEHRIIEERDGVTALAAVFTLELRVLALIRREDDVASGDEERPSRVWRMGIVDAIESHI